MSSKASDGGVRQIVIYGAGAMARELCWLAECSGDARDVVGMVDDDPAQHGRIVNGIRVYGLVEARSRFPDARMIVAIGSAKGRESAAARAHAAGFSFDTLLHSRVERSRWIEIGEGTVICAGSILTTNIRLGRHVQVNTNCTVAHDVILGDFATLAPAVNVSGHVQIGARAYIGTNAVIINGRMDAPIVIGDDAVVGASACVTRSVPVGATVVGVPAHPHRRTQF